MNFVLNLDDEGTFISNMNVLSILNKICIEISDLSHPKRVFIHVHKTLCVWEYGNITLYLNINHDDENISWYSNPRDGKSDNGRTINSFIKQMKLCMIESVMET